MPFDYDYIVIGSGFGGSVAALRLREKGYSVCVIERGRRWHDEDYAKTNWLLWKWLWMPNLFCSGCVIGADRDHGVIDSKCNVFGYKNFYIVDGAAIPANLGVNPSLTITAIAEYAMSQIPKRDPHDEH